MATVELTADDLREDRPDERHRPRRLLGVVVRPVPHSSRRCSRQLERRHTDIVFGKVDTEAEQELAAAAHITSIPTLMAFRDGILVFAQPGALPAAALEQVIAAIRGWTWTTSGARCRPSRPQRSRPQPSRLDLFPPHQRGHRMELNPEEMQAVVKRLKRAQGHIGGILKMIDDGRECQDIVTQLAAVSKALDRAGFAVIALGLRQCITDPDSHEMDATPWRSCSSPSHERRHDGCRRLGPSLRRRRPRLVRRAERVGARAVQSDDAR